MAELALSMARDAKGHLCEEYAFVDVKHKRSRDYKSVTLWSYHQTLRKVIRLAVVDVDQENTENMTNFHAIKNVFGEGGTERIRTCEIVVVIMCRIIACAERR